MLQDIQNLELVPPVGAQVDISSRLAELFAAAKSFRAAIAFWTLSADVLDTIIGSDAIRVLTQPNSFLCVDINYPTNIDSLATLVRKNVSIYLNIRRLPEDISKITKSPGLMHTKVILADKTNEKAEFWIGSHNWTQFALKGPNTEASLAVHMNNNTQLYSEVVALLEDIRRTYCKRFELNKVEYYKKLQRYLYEMIFTRKVIDLEGRNVADLDGQVINVFDDTIKNYKLINEVGMSVKVVIYDTEAYDDTGEEKFYVYTGRVLHSGHLPSYDSAASGIDITEMRRYAFTDRGRWPILLPSQEIENSIFENAYYFATIQLQGPEDVKYEFLEPPSHKVPLWVEAEFDPIIERMDVDYYKKHRDQSLVLVPRDDERAHPKYRHEEWTDYQKTSLAQKRVTKEHSLISRKIVRRLEE